MCSRCWPRSSRRRVLAVGLLLVASLAREAGAQENIPTLVSPEAYLGFQIGEDRKLADWEQITGYLARLASQSDRVRIDTLGRTTLDRPLVLLTISDPANLARLDEYRSIQALLADPRRIASPEQRRDLIDRGRLVVLVTAAIHSTEVGSSQLPLRLAYRLASSTEAEDLRVLRETIVLVVPALNPDGVQSVAEWYRSTVDMPWEGVPPPFLYHHYAGHDNNRDWYAITQQETQLVVGGVHNVWHPQIVHDIHQQRSNGSRFFVPPWRDPIEPNVDPLLISAANALGAAIAWDVHRTGKSGVAVNAVYDAWSPARAYPHYHAGVRLLSETASARLASPVDLSVDDLEAAEGFDPRQPSWNHPEPWPGGRWALADILDYMETGAMALLRRAAEDRTTWLENFVAVGERAVAGWNEWPAAWVILGGQTNTAGTAELVRILQAGGVEVREALGPLRAGGRNYPMGSYVIDMRQPYAAFAQTLLEVQRYPARTDPATGEPRRPYDGTAHTLPLLLGVEAVAVRGSVVGGTALLAQAPTPPPRRVPGLSEAPDVLVGLYQSWGPSIDEGWTRWVFDRYAVPYAVLHNEDIIRGRLIDRFTAIVLPSEPPERLRSGREEELPPRYAGGLAGAGVEALREFAEAGGTLVALDQASSFLLEELELPIADKLSGLEEREYQAAGAIVALRVDSAVAAAAGIPPRSAAWVEGGPALIVQPGSSARTLATFGRSPTVLSGWLHGAEHLAGAGALVEASVGRGVVVLFGFRPQYRGQSLATYPLLFHVLRRRAAR